MKSPYVIKTVLLLIFIFALLLSQLIWDVASSFNPEKIQEMLLSAGSLAPLLYMAVMACAIVISPIPSLPLDIAAGAFFGPLAGTLYSVLGALAGAVISFLITRLLGRETIEKYSGGHFHFCEQCSDKVMTRIVFLSRLIPVVSFDVISYGAGLTKMSLKKFSLATFFGMIPLTFVYNYFGSVLVFGEGLTVILGMIIVVLFLVLPDWLEKKGFMKHIKNK